MSIKIIGNTLNFSNNSEVLFSKNIIMGVGKNITFETGSRLLVNSSDNTVYFPDSSKIYISDTTVTLSTKLSNGIPIGCIMIWSGTVATIPSGWASCDGSISNGITTPNLEGLFIIGTSTTYPVNVSGGNLNNSITLTTSNLPEHTHTGNTSTGGATHKHTYRSVSGSGSTTGAGATTDSTNRGSVTSSLSGSHSHTLVTGTTGSGTAVSIIPPYYSLIYIIKTL